MGGGEREGGMRWGEEGSEMGERKGVRWGEDGGGRGMRGGEDERKREEGVGGEGVD